MKINRSKIYELIGRATVFIVADILAVLFSLWALAQNTIY